jgi:hypothetical protein
MKPKLSAWAFVAFMFIGMMPVSNISAQPFLGGEITWDCTPQSQHIRAFPISHYIRWQSMRSHLHVVAPVVPQLRAVPPQQWGRPELFRQKFIQLIMHTPMVSLLWVYPLPVVGILLMGAVAEHPVKILQMDPHYVTF